MSAEKYEFALIASTASTTAYDAMMKVLESKQYNASKMSEWVDKISNQIITKMREVSPFFKYLVTCFIIEQVGAGVHYETVAHWDASTDGTIMSKYENDNLICICTVVGVAI